MDYFPSSLPLSPSFPPSLPPSIFSPLSPPLLIQSVRQYYSAVSTERQIYTGVRRCLGVLFGEDVQLMDGTGAPFTNIPRGSDASHTEVSSIQAVQIREGWYGVSVYLVSDEVGTVVD